MCVFYSLKKVPFNSTGKNIFFSRYPCTNNMYAHISLRHEYADTYWIEMRKKNIGSTEMDVHLGIFLVLALIINQFLF